MNSITKNRVSIIIGFIILLAFSVLFYYSTIIEASEVSIYSPFEQQIEAEVINCMVPFNGVSYLFLSDVEVSESILDCNIMIKESTHKASFPNKVKVFVEVVNPVVKVIEELEDGSEECTLFESSSVYRKLASERCVKYTLVEINGPNIPNDSFRVEYLILIEKLSNENGIVVEKITEKGDTLITWYDLILDSGVHVYLPQGENIEKKIVTLAHSLKGLQDASEKYTLIDLRFDRVVYK